MISSIWQEFAEKFNLNEAQLLLFKKYYSLLLEHNNYAGLTTITNLEEVIYYHFQDSLYLQSIISADSIRFIADVGSGGGFPGIPLKILYPQIKFILIEVDHKKVSFLNQVIKSLELIDIEVISMDWRTFLRKTEYPVDLFVARASLQVEELLRIYKPSSLYNNSKLVYWASTNWVPEPKEAKFIKGEVSYTVGVKNRRLVLFGKES